MKRRKLGVEQGQWDTANIVALREALRSHLSLYRLRDTNLVPPGYHQVSFNRLPKEFELCEDGAERRHAPNPDWKYRVWAGGYLEFQNPFVYVDNPTFVAVNERITDTRLVGDPDAEDAKLYVTLTRNLIKAQRDDEGTPILKNDRFLLPGNGHKARFIKEEKYLCFMKKIPPILQASQSSGGSGDGPPRRLLRPPTAPTYAQSMVPSATLLFRFSALTRNAHAIHLDPEYTRATYGLPKLLVHGPLTSVLMLDILGEALEMHSLGKDYTLAVRSFSYKNLLPLFVGEPITIACRKLHDLQARNRKFISHFAKPWEKWDVWIQRGTGENATMAVKGEAWVSPSPRPRGREKGQYQSMMESAEDEL